MSCCVFMCASDTLFLGELVVQRFGWSSANAIASNSASKIVAGAFVVFQLAGRAWMGADVYVCFPSSFGGSA